MAAGSVLSKTFGGGAAMASGYQVLRFTAPAMLPAGEQQAYSACLESAQAQAKDVLRERGITDPYKDLSTQIELNHQLLIEQADLDCPSLWDVIADPVSEPIELPFTDQPMRSTF